MLDVKYFIFVKYVVKILICCKKKNLSFVCGNFSIVLLYVIVYLFNIFVISVKSL